MGKSRKPFHESLVDAIRSAVERPREMPEMFLLAQLIKDTKIPAGHDEILAAWKQLRQKHTHGEGDPDIFDVIADLAEQKSEAAKREAAEAAESMT